MEGEERIFVGRTVRVFLSYSTEDKWLAGRIKYHLEDYGIEVFLAHEDIAPSEEWQDAIIRNLKVCDLFMPLLTDNFKGSEWTDQESGIAVSERKAIVPLKVSIDPYGFIGRYQAFKFDMIFEHKEGRVYYHLSGIEASCCELLKWMAKNKLLEESMKDCFIRAFVKSYTFKDAERRAGLLGIFDSFGSEQVREIVRGSIQNNQIHGSWGAQAFLKKFVEKHSDHIEPDQKKELLKLMENRA